MNQLGLRKLSRSWVWMLALVNLSGCAVISQVLPSVSLPLPLPPGSPPAIAVQSSTTSQMEAQVRQRINEVRRKQGLSELRNNEKLAQVARNYSRRMAEENFFSHNSPKGDTMVKRVRSAGISYVLLGENLFTCTNVPQPVPAAIDGWMNSPGHRKNILQSGFRETGIGVWRKGNKYYFTQLFMRSI
ncbi:CAP domain-containing protein [Leptolyngbya sp. FACHB-36]|uniref:CAP domain-containing protein n=1 Tax=Leptolyngbya sp. FACHB-36 TaxID=2692808 RepID=UPI0016817F3F|nr:CAP domain-containing protein [Leptolyngbya sp. FACHB-36]MBD2020565.1 CAP domain-containing protein [Leptolyngbya sp. FACHB-36]